MSANQTRFASDWPEKLHAALTPCAVKISEIAERFLSEAQGSEDLRTDASRLERAGSDLWCASESLLDPASRPADVAPEEIIRRTRHDLMNMLNRVLGYSQLLLEVAEDEGLSQIAQADLQRVYDLAKECERTILQHLARTSRPDTEVTPTATPTQTTAPSQRPTDPCTILVVDDDENARIAVVRVLRSQGHTLVEAENGEVGLSLLLQRSFDLVLLDIDMPKMNGYELLRAVRSDRRWDGMPVLMISGQDELANTVRCIEAGAEDFLPKPVDHILLRARINSLLARRQMRVRELEQFFPPEVARQLIEHPELLEEGEQKEITILFCDIRGYSRISRRLGPAMTIEWVSSVMEELTECILANGGVLVDFIGDELMAMWGAPGDQPDHAERACRTALQMLACLPRLNVQWRDRLGEAIDFGVGMNSGVAWVGNSGTRRKFKYGPSGDTVNVGSRVQGATKYLKARVIMSKATHERLGGKFLSRRLGKVEVVNINEPVELFQVVPDDTANWDETKNRYQEALELFEAGKLEEAARSLGRLIADQGAQGPPLGLMARTIEGLMARDKWSPVFTLPGK